MVVETRQRLVSTHLKPKSLNFFERRAILKKANYLELTPMRQMEYDVLETGRVDILMPRFKHPVLKRALQPHRKQEIIPIHLDEIGSAIWMDIDGFVKVHEICSQVQSSHEEKLQPPEETEKRVTEFLSMLYQQRYITFREIIKEKK